MLKTRIIPVLLLQNSGLYKTIQFKDPIYIGDPINCVRIFNEKEVDELIFLDITATKEKRAPNFDIIQMIASECFMPFAYGGGVSTVKDAENILARGAEKIVLNSVLYRDLNVVEDIAKRFGTQAIVASLDVRKGWLGNYTLYSEGGTVKQTTSLNNFLEDIQNAGIGEIMINSIDQDGLQKGYDVELIKFVSDKTNLPVIACGGAGNLAHMKEVVYDGGASAVAAGSMFVFHGKHRAVLITYPSPADIEGYLI